MCAATIYDVARMSGVSIATVSRVINKESNVSPKTRDKVQAAIEAVGFVPNAFARGLNFNSIGLVGVLCTDFGDAFFSQAVAYLEEFLRNENLNTILACTGYTPQGKKDGLNQIISKNVDAIILIGTVFQEDMKDYIAEIAQKTPVFMVNAIVDFPNMYSVRCDEKKAAREAIQALVEAGYTKPLYLYEKPSYGNMEKLAGVQEGVQGAGLEWKPEQMLSLGDTNEDDIPIIMRHLCVYRGMIDSIFTCNDSLAVYALKALIRTGQKMPVIGFNDSSIARLSEPEVTSVDNRLREMCRLTVEHLVQLRRGKGVPPHIKVLDGKLVHRVTF